MNSSVYSCSECRRRLISDAIYCPHCLIDRIDVRDKWFPMSGEGVDNPIVNHSLVPEHRVVPEERVAQLCREYLIDRTDLPCIKDNDPAIQHLTCGTGDVVEIVRDSRTTDTARSYRLIVSESGSISKETQASAEWRNPAEPAKTTYSQETNLSDEQALHIVENLRAHIPPSQPGTCRQIAIDRKAEIQIAIDRVEAAEPYTFIQGELGYGKSFFLHWIRDEVLPWTAVSLVDLDDRTNFLDPAMLVEAFRTNLETPRSIANSEYANGLDELWDTSLRKIAGLCASTYERRGFEVREERVRTSLELAARDILSEADVPERVVDEVAKIASEYFDSGPQSLSQALIDEVGSDDPMDVLGLISSLAGVNGYRVLLGVDELEKSDRREKHFESINEFVEKLPENVSLFVTGTPELVEGGNEGNALIETHQTLYERTVKNRILLGSPSREDLVEFSKRVVNLEEQALEFPRDREYAVAIEGLGGFEASADAFLEEQSPAFRAYLSYLELQ